MPMPTQHQTPPTAPVDPKRAAEHAKLKEMVQVGLDQLNRGEGREIPDPEAFYKEIVAKRKKQ